MRAWWAVTGVALVIAVPVALSISRGREPKQVELEVVTPHVIAPLILASGTLSYQSEVRLVPEVIARVVKLTPLRFYMLPIVALPEQAVNIGHRTCLFAVASLDGRIRARRYKFGLIRSWGQFPGNLFPCGHPDSSGATGSSAFAEQRLRTALTAHRQAILASS